MKQVLVHKLGIDFYGNNQANDKNGGLYEYNLINNRIMHITKKYSESIARDVIFFVNGNSEPAEQEQLLNTYKDYFKVFIVTDYFAFNKNKEIIDECDVVLHQSMNGNIPIPSRKANAFSYVPYLFFKYPSPRCFDSQNGYIIFGGANTGRNDKFDKYIMKDKESSSIIKAFTKIYGPDGTVLSDTRIPYDKFMKEMRDYSYALMITRREYTESAWFTPRFVEAVSNWALPIVDIDYPLPFDMLKHSVMIVKNYEELKQSRSYFNNSNSASVILSYLANFIVSNVEKFDWLIYQILLGVKFTDIYKL